MNILGVGQALVLHLGGATWTPASPTAGGVLPHTWMRPGVANFQDSLLTTPATADGDPVGGVTNQGSDSYSITQATTGAKPTLKLNILNSKPVWRFDGGDFLRGAFAGGLVAMPVTIFAVARLSPAGGAASRAICDGDDATNRAVLYQNTANNWIEFAGVNLSGGASDANWNIWTALFNGASSQFWLNGTSKATGNSGTSPGLDGLTIGGFNNNTAGWINDIANLLIYAGNLSTADKNQINRFLGTTFGLSYTVIV